MSESKEPPRLPDVVDEAAASPRWLPWLGFGLLAAVAGLAIAQQALKPRGETAGEKPGLEAAAGAEAQPEPAK